MSAWDDIREWWAYQGRTVRILWTIQLTLAFLGLVLAVWALVAA